MIGYVLVATAFAVICCGCGLGKPAELGEPEITTYTASVLGDIARDINAATQKYDGKVVALTGKVSSGSERSRQVYLKAPGVPTDRRIRCRLNEGEPVPNMGSTVTIIGRMNINQSSRLASMRNCRMQ